MLVRSAITATGDDALREQILALIPHMRSFARGLSCGAVDGDDLVQEALIKAWKCRSSFELGTNLKSWLFRILRNEFFSEKRKSWRSAPLDPGQAEKSLIASDDPTMVLSLNEVRQALCFLPDAQREALLLVGAGGLSYEEAAEITGAALGTVKSRVSRARDALAVLVESGDYKRDQQPARNAMASINREIMRLQEAHSAAAEHL